MRAQFRSVLPVLLSLAPLGAGTPDFNPLLSVAQATWPEKQHIGVVCSYAASRDEVSALAASAAPGSRITVVDASTASALNSALQVLDKRKADYLVMLSGDPLYFEGGFQATQLVRGLAQMGIPSVGTSPAGVKQGADFAIGERTGHQLLVTSRLRGTVSVILPSRTAAFQGDARSYRTGRGVEVDVLTAP